MAGINETVITVPRVGTTGNIISYTVNEDATPIDPDSSAGGVGSVSFSLLEGDDSPLIAGTVTLDDGYRGVVQGSVRSKNGSDGVLTATADSLLGRFNVERSAAPFSGTLQGAVQYYLNRVGITNPLVVDTTIASRAVVCPGWTGNAWVRMKQFLSAQQIEMALVAGRVRVRALRQLTATEDRATQRSWDIADDQNASAIDITYYQNTYGVNQEFYPVPRRTEEDSEPQIITVNANEVVEVELPIAGTLSTVNQPSILAWVDNRPYPGTNGVYAVLGSDELPVQPAQWIARGGSVTVSITDDPGIIRVRVRGASDTSLSPYRLAMGSGSGNYYSSLRITGTGVKSIPEVLRIPTGANTPFTSQDIGILVENPFVSGYADAINLGIKTAQAYAGQTYTIGGSVLRLNRDEDQTDLPVGYSILDFNSALGGTQAISVFNTNWSGQTIAQFNAYWQDQASDFFRNQMFGNAVGARILRKDANFRITTASTTKDSISYGATMDTLVGDFNGANGTLSIAAFNARFAGYTCQDFSTVPLRT